MTLLLIIALGSFKLNAQDSAIYKKGLSWRMNGQKLNVKELKTEIYKVPDAIPYYKKARKNIWVSLGVDLITIGTMMLMPEYRKPQYLNKENRGRYIVGIGGLGLGYYFMFKSNSNFHKAIKIRNEKIVSLY